MAGTGISFGKTALLALALGGAAVPLAGAMATAEDVVEAPTADMHAGHAMGSADEATATAPAMATLTDEQAAASRALFNQYACGACHTLSAAGGTGNIGPSLDGNANLDQAYIVSRVSNGQGQMPGFGGMIPADQIDQLARYILQVKQ